MGSVGSMNNQSLGISGVRNIIGEDSFNSRYDTEFIDALANARLEYEDDEIKFRFMGKDKSTGRTVLMDITAQDKETAKRDIRANGYTIQRLYTSQVYDAVINHSDGERWDLSDATKVDNALLKKRRR